MLKLYHYSNAEIKGYIKPSFFGSNYFTKNSKELSTLKRIYFYTNKNKREYFFNGSQYCYIAYISKNSLYDVYRDNLKLYSRYNDIDKILRLLKNKGFKGIIGGRVVELFHRARAGRRAENLLYRIKK